MEHQHAAAEAIGAYLEARTMGRKGIGARRPGHVLSRRRCCQVVFAVIEDDLKAQIRTLREIFVALAGGAVAIAYTLYITVGRAGQPGTISLLSLGKINVGRVLGFVVIGD